ncbi:rod shape-determining protein MreD [Marinicrinis lubricantis]|uniref:Rod shape-determining protein MreD n=1 Tax=Marinicrinis lubricantis TaxID=2086470 RepID=A0ABW1ITS7_9BACL
MKKQLIWWIIFVVFILEGSLLPWFIPASWQDHISFHFVYVLILYVALQGRRHFALALGVSFGFLQDLLYYGHMLGLFTFTMGLGAYSVALFNQRKPPAFVGSLLFVIGALVYLELAVDLLYRLFQINQESFVWTMLHYALPSLLFNLFFAAAIYIPIRVLLDKSNKKAKREND